MGLGYIDKIPLAKMKQGTTDVHGNEITEKTEVGDAAFFFIDEHYSDGSLHSRSARCLILQAKQASTGTLPKVVPIVQLPKKQNNSTLKELALLSTWPTFDLYFSSGSKKPLQAGYDVSSSSVNGVVDPPKAWYIGASPHVTSAWSPRWIAGPSVNGAVCDETLGSILHAVLENRGSLRGSEAVGKSFNFDPARLKAVDFKLASTSTPPNWDDLCHQLILACSSIDLPHHLFRESAKRRVWIALHANPLGPILATVGEFLKAIGRKLGLCKPRRFSVVIVERRSGEGAFPPLS
ncbi:hypothetical protein H5A44_10060 [Pectobacterium brasiliense]|uniref:hypothetical protein n=1 Tax=Pectobacterium brasiliense TaxID=180957 RepID=UPI001969E9D8|nr:hypothetical protein [Pectobacterium brasiliense]MBN3342774.1 hypothetical protein [Pectobacterium brasiliense]